jgi:hypothetical protein
MPPPDPRRSTSKVIDANAGAIKRVNPRLAGVSSTGLPIWVSLLLALLVTVYRLSRLPSQSARSPCPSGGEVNASGHRDQPVTGGAVVKVSVLR